MFLRWFLLAWLSGIAVAQDTAHALWIMPTGSGVTSLQAENSGRIRETRAQQEDSRCWHLAAAPNRRFYILCNDFGGRRGLELRQGKPVLAVGPGQPWKITASSAGVYRLECPQGRLGDHDWILWSRQRLGRRPEAGNYLRSDLGQYWRVQKNNLAGRSEPNEGARVAKRFNRGTVLLADWGRGGSDEVLWNLVDENGNTWLKVKDRQGRALDCYVRAHPTWLKPFDLDQSR